MNPDAFAVSSAPIGIFDSGIGGLTVARCLQEKLPSETLCYFGDTARVPYGTKSAETVTRYSLEIARFLLSHNAKILVAACNTVSTTALDAVREVFPGPVIGVVEPGVRAAMQATRNGRIGVIGTRGAINSGSYQKRLMAQEPTLRVIAQPCPLFVPLAEEGWTDDRITYEVAKRYLDPLLKESIDVLILGCTHFPLLTDVIQEVMGDGVILINSAQEVTREVHQTLRELGSLSPQKQWQDLFYASDDIAGFERLYRRICGDISASFVEAPSDFFAIVQEVHRYRGRIFADQLQWFQPISSG